MHARRLLIGVLAFFALAAPAHAAAGWAPTGSLGAPRLFGSAVLLDSGKVLLAGGFAPGGATRTAELYDPATGTWSPAGSMTERRAGFPLVKLGNGKVLAAGGYAGSTEGLSSADLYDPATNAWSAVKDMSVGRARPAGIARPDGTALIAGGRAAGGTVYHGSAEVFDPRDNTWRTLPSSFSPGRWDLSGVALAGGGALFAGGFHDSSWEATAFTYDDANGFGAAGAMTVSRSIFGLSALPDGRAVATGGNTPPDAYTFSASADVYNPGTRSWSPAAPMSTPHYGHTQTTLANGRVLVAAGVYNTAGDPGATTEIFDPATNTWTPAGLLATARFFHTGTLLRDGRVLVAGGQIANSGSTATAELYTPPTALSVAGAVGFDTAGVGTRPSAPLQITNTGDATLFLTVVALGGAEPGQFGANAERCRTVAPGATCVIDVVFAPTAAGAHNAILTFAANTAAGTYAVNLSGRATADTDGDGVADADDRCGTLKGPASRQGCPTGLLADPSIRYRPSGKGIRVLAYYVKATTGAKVTVKCSKGCRSTTTKGKGAKRVRITRLNGKRLANGTKVTITVSKTGRLTTTVTDRVSRGRRIEGRPRCTPVGC